MEFRSKKYTDWVRSQPSALSGMSPCDPHHIKGHGYGGSVKASDILTMPLTREEHDDLHRGWRSWEEKHGVTQPELICKTIKRAVEDGVIEVVL